MELLVNLIAVTLILLILWRFYHHRYAERVYKYSLYELRDRIRMYAIENPGKDVELFKAYDFVLSRSICQAHFLTLFSIIISEIKGEKNEYGQKTIKVLAEKREKNEFYSSIHSELVDATLHYVLDQHLVSGKTIIVPLANVMIGANSVISLVRRGTEEIIYAPSKDGDKLASA